MNKYASIFESILRSLDGKAGIIWPAVVESFKFLKDAVMFRDDGVVSESLDVFKSSMLANALEFFNDVYDVKIVSHDAFLDSILDKKPEKHFQPDDFVVILKFDFCSYGEFISCFSKAFKKSKEELEQDDDVCGFFDRLVNDSFKAAYAKTEDAGRRYSVFIIDNRGCTVSIVKHEMIHYLQSVCGIGYVDNKKLIGRFQSDDTYGLIDKNHLSEVFSREEMLPYVHGFCYVLEDHGIRSTRDALDVLDKFLCFNGDPNSYIEYCKALDEYGWFAGEKTPIHMIMLAAIHRKSMKVFRTVVAKYFKN